MSTIESLSLREREVRNLVPHFTSNTIHQEILYENWQVQDTATMFELTCVKLSDGLLTHESTVGRDTTADRPRDFKLTTSQNAFDKRNGKTYHRFIVAGLENKECPILVHAYNKITDRFQYFAIPSKYVIGKNTIKISIDTATGLCNSSKYKNYEVDSLKTLSLIDLE